MCLVACLLMTGATAAWAQATPSPKPAEVAPDQPVPLVITAPRDVGAPPASGVPEHAELLVQVAAANAALNAFNKELLANHIRTCVADDIRAGNDETIDELVGVLQKLMK